MSINASRVNSAGTSPRVLSLLNIKVVHEVAPLGHVTVVNWKLVEAMIPMIVKPHSPAIRLTSPPSCFQPHHVRVISTMSIIMKMMMSINYWFTSMLKNARAGKPINMNTSRLII